MDHDKSSDEVIDEASEDSFPASDPPAQSSPAEDRGPDTASDPGSQGGAEDERKGGDTTEQRPPSDS